jgi:DNA (cytosine-5)-methyltransferase 1
MVQEKSLSAIDLFCGAGGMSLGLQRSGYDIIGAIDSWKPATDSYKRNFTHPVLHHDISTLTVEGFWSMLGLEPKEINLIAGGPPCQGFSVQRIGSDHDTRNAMIFDFGRFVCEIRPDAFLLENVPGLLGTRGREIANRFEEMVLSNGYSVTWSLINAADYGVPQFRKRVFCLGWRNDKFRTLILPAPDRRKDQFVSVWDAIGDLPSPPADFMPSPKDRLHRRMKMSNTNLERLKHIPPGGGFESLPKHLRVPCHRNGPEKIGHRYVYGRLRHDTPAGTITARFDSFTRGKFAHPFENRNITLREGARLQTFDDDFEFLGTQEEIAALIGNAVPPVLAESIGRAIYKQLLQPSPPAEAPSRSRPERQLEMF